VAIILELEERKVIFQLTKNNVAKIVCQKWRIFNSIL